MKNPHLINIYEIDHGSLNKIGEIISLEYSELVNNLIFNRNAMKDKACHTQGFWDIYKAINFKRGQSFDCSWCEGKLKLKWKSQNKTFGARLLSGFIWMSPAIALIILTAAGNMSAFHAIILITLFHFAAMYFLINSGRLTVKNIESKRSPKKKKK